jgi:hypothetical protein
VRSPLIDLAAGEESELRALLHSAFGDDIG